MSSQNEFIDEYPNLIAEIFDIQNILLGKSHEALKKYKNRALITALQSNEHTGLDNQEKISKNQKHFGGNNSLVEQNFTSILKFLGNYFRSQFFLWMTFFIPLFQLCFNNQDISLEEYQCYKNIVVILIITALYYLIIEYQVIRNKNNFLTKRNNKLVAVIREKEQFISCQDLVVGDVLLFQPGDVFPVDGILLEGISVMVDESLLTNNSFPLYKKQQSTDSTTQSLNYYCNPFLFSGTKCVNGYGKMLVLAVGKNRFSSKLQINTQYKMLTSESLKINGYIFWINFLISTLIFFIILVRLYNDLFNLSTDIQMLSLLYKLLFHEIPKEMIYFLSIFYFTIPLSLPLEIIRQIQQFYKDYNLQQIVFQDISSIEQLSLSKQIDIQDINKFNQHQQLEAIQLYLGLKQYYVDFKLLRINLNSEVIDILSKSIYNNSAIRPIQDNQTNQWMCIGDKLESALINFSSQLGKYYDQCVFDNKFIIQKYYNQNRKCMSSVCIARQTNNIRIYTKGEAALILGFCKYYLTSDGQKEQLTEIEINQIKDDISKIKQQSFISIAIAYKDLMEVPIILADVEEEESNLTFLCILQFQDISNPHGNQNSLHYFQDHKISIIFGEEINFGQTGNFNSIIKKSSITLQYTFTEVVYRDEELSIRDKSQENIQNTNNNANLEQITQAVQISKRIQKILIDLVQENIQNKITMLTLILSHFLQFGSNPFIIQQIMYFNLVFDLFLLLLKFNQSCCKNKNSKNLTTQNQKLIAGALCTFMIQIVTNLFIQITIPKYINSYFPSADHKKFKLTIFVHLIIYNHIIQHISKFCLQNVLEMVLFLCLVVINSYILVEFSDFFQIYKIDLVQIKGLFILLIIVALTLKFLFKLVIKQKIHINKEPKSYVIDVMDQRYQYLHSFVEYLSKQQINSIIFQRKQIVQKIKQINLQEEKKRLEKELTTDRDALRKKKKEEEEYRNKKKKEEEEDRNRKRKQEEEDRKRKQEEEERKRKLEEEDKKRKQEEEERKRKIEEEDKRRKQEEEERKRKIEEEDKRRKQEEEQRKRKLEEEDKRRKQEEEERKRKLEEEDKRRKQEEEERKRKLEEEDRKRKRKQEEEEEERKRKQEEEEEERKREQEDRLRQLANEQAQSKIEVTKMREEISKLQELLTNKIQRDSLSKNQWQYSNARNSQKLIRLMLNSKEAITINQPTSNELLTYRKSLSLNENTSLNINIPLYVLKESLSDKVEIVQTSKCIGGLESLFVGQNNDQQCFRINLNQQNQSYLNKRNIFDDAQKKISKACNVEINQVEILGGLEDNSTSIDFKIKGKEEIEPQEKQLLQKELNCTLNHFLYFQSTNDQYNKNQALKYIGLSNEDFNPKFNRNWKNEKSFAKRGPQHHRYDYFYPKQCVGYGLQVSNKYENDDWLKMDGNPGEWRILFHGTKQQHIVPITKEGLKPGEIQNHEKGYCAFTKQQVGKGIYFSDKIEICKRYTNPVQVGNFNIRVYFMSRVRPEAIRQSLQMKDLNYFVVNNSQDIRPYRILLEEEKVS